MEETKVHQLEKATIELLNFDGVAIRMDRQRK